MELNSLLTAVTAVGTGTTTVDYNLDPNRCPYVKFFCVASSSLVGSFQVSYDHGVTFYDRPCTDSNGTAYVAGASVSLSAGTELLIETGGVTDVRFTKASGTGSLMLAKLLLAPGGGGAGGGAASAPQPGTRSAGTVAGNAATKLPTSDQSGRSLFSITNNSTLYDLWLRYVADGEAAPTISSTTYDRVVGPGKTVDIELSDAWDVYGQNSSGGATTSNYVLQELI